MPERFRHEHLVTTHHQSHWQRTGRLNTLKLDELYKESDVISLHCRQNYLLDATAFGKMKDGVMIVNTSRGEFARFNRCN
ncbi:NAD(P)-dependent oxidoreductase [Vibrio lentus]|nr:NAD(P)-dependent oxidoreductase [Vibrio lentus]